MTAFFLRPALERRCTRQIESVEKRSGHQRYGPRAVARYKRGAKFGYVRRHECFVKNERRAGGAHDLTAEVLSQRVARLAERVGGAAFVGIGPEEAGQPVARHAAISRR